MVKFHMELNYGVVITGGIACGKTTVCNELKALDYKIIDVDLLGKQAMDMCKKEVLDTFECADKNGNIDRVKLGKLFFEDKNTKQKLEAILHPKMFELLFTELKYLENEKKVYFIDFPIFFETGQKFKPKKIVTVYTPSDIQLQRLINRNNLSKIEAQNRLDAQYSVELKKELSDIIIDNSLDLNNTRIQITRMIDDIN